MTAIDAANAGLFWGAVIVLLHAIAAWIYLLVRFRLLIGPRISGTVQHAWYSWKRTLLLVTVYFGVVVPPLTGVAQQSAVAVVAWSIIAWFVVPSGFRLLTKWRLVTLALWSAVVWFLVQHRDGALVRLLLPSRVPPWIQVFALAMCLRAALPPFFLILGRSAEARRSPATGWLHPLLRSIDMRLGGWAILNVDRQRANKNWVVQVQRLMELCALIVVDVPHVPDPDRVGNFDAPKNHREPLQTEFAIIDALQLWPKVIIIGALERVTLPPHAQVHGFSGWELATPYLKRRIEALRTGAATRCGTP